MRDNRGQGARPHARAAGRLSALSHVLPGAADDVIFTCTYNAPGQILTRVVSNPAYAYAVSAGTTAYAKPTTAVTR